MALTATHNDISFGVGDVIKVHQKVKDKIQVFEGMVIGIKGRDLSKTFTVRRIGAQKIGIEQIIPLSLPTIEKIEVVKKGVEGVKHAKLFYTRKKSPKEIEKIYSRAASRNKKVVKKTKRVVKKSKPAVKKSPKKAKKTSVEK